MKTRIDFIKIPRSEVFAKEFEKRLASISRQFSFRRRDQAVSAHARFIGTAFSSVGKLLEVEAELQIFVPNRKDVVVCRKGKDIKLVAVEAIAAAEKMLRREAKKKESSRHTFAKTRRRLKHTETVQG